MLGSRVIAPCHCTDECKPRAPPRCLCVCGVPPGLMHAAAGFDGYAGALVPYDPAHAIVHGGPAFSAAVCHGEACAAPGGAPVPHDAVMMSKDLKIFLGENKCSEQLLITIEKSDWPHILYGDSSKAVILTLFNFTKLNDTQIAMMHLTTEQKIEIEQLISKAKEVFRKRAEKFDQKYPPGSKHNGSVQPDMLSDKHAGISEKASELQASKERKITEFHNFLISKGINRILVPKISNALRMHQIRDLKYLEPADINLTLNFLDTTTKKRLLELATEARSNDNAVTYAAPDGAPVPYDAAQGVASVGTAYDETKVHHGSRFVNNRTNIIIDFYHDYVFLMDRHARKIYVGRDHIKLFIGLHEDVKIFFIAYGNGKKTTDRKNVNWGFLIRLAKWYNKLNGTEKELVTFRIACTVDVQSPHFKRAFGSALVRAE